MTLYAKKYYFSNSLKAGLMFYNDLLILAEKAIDKTR